MLTNAPPHTARRLATITLVLLLLAANAYQYYSDLPPKNPSASEVVARFHRLFDANPSGLNLSKWLGVPCWQNPNDVWIIQEIITEVKPDFIIETGTLFGGSAALWATVLREVNPDGRVLSIDIRDQADQARALPVVQQRVDFLLGSSVAPEIVQEVEKRVQGKTVLVIFDSDHSKKHVLAELNAYWRLVGVGSYLIVQDTDINGHPVRPEFGPGPMEAVLEFIATNDHFRVDRDRERLLFTMHPNGYLQRVR